MTAADLKSALLPNYAYTSGASYSRVSRAYLQGDFWSYYRAQLAKIAVPGANVGVDGDLRTWMPDWPCWCFTAYYLVLLQAANVATAGAGGTSFAAAGRWDFHPDASRGIGAWNENHSIVCAFTDFGIDYLDPQNNTLWIPLKSEILTTKKLDF